MKIFLVLTLILSSFNSAYAQYRRNQNNTGPYKLIESKAHIGQKIINIIDNSTVGAVQTTLGAAHIVMYAVLNPIKGEGFVKFDTHIDEKSEVSQIIIDEDIPWFSGAYSLGLFQVGGHFCDHEGGHAIASGAMGPLYLPAVGLSYLMEGHDSSLFEDWADLEARSKEYGLTGDISVGAGAITVGDHKHNVMVIKASIDQTQMQLTSGMSSYKSLQWLNTTILRQVVDKMNPNGDLPPLVEIDLLKKNINLVVENLSVYLGNDQDIKTIIKTEQKYLHLEDNVLLGKAQAQLLTWATEFGFQYNYGDVIKVTPTAGVHAGLDFFKDTPVMKNFLNTKDYKFNPSLGYSVGVDIELLDYLNWENEYRKNWHFDGTKINSFYTGVSNEFRNPVKDIGFLQWIEVGAGYETNVAIPGDGGSKRSSSQWNFRIGLRF